MYSQMHVSLKQHHTHYLVHTHLNTTDAKCLSCPTEPTPAEFPEFPLLHRASHRLPFHTCCQISCLNGSLPHSHLDLLLGQALEVSTTQSTHISGLSPCPTVLPHCVTTPYAPSPWTAGAPPPGGLLLLFLFFKTPSNSSTPSPPPPPTTIICKSISQISGISLPHYCQYFSIFL